MDYRMQSEQQSRVSEMSRTVLDDVTILQHPIFDMEMSEKLIETVSSAVEGTVLWDSDYDQSIESAELMNKIQLMLEAGADPNAECHYSNKTCLHFVTWSNIECSAEIVELLLSYGASPNIADFFRNTPLLYASMSGIENRVVQKLISSGADVNKADMYGRTSLHHAASHGRIEMVRMLLSAKAAADPLDHFKTTPLLLAMRSNSNNNEQRLEIARQLIRAGANVNAMDTMYDGGMTTSCLLFACRYGDAETANLLRLSGASLTVLDKKGHNALFHATKSGNVNLVGKLIDAGLNINFVNAKGDDFYPSKPMTTIHIAIEKDDVNMLKFLLERGANPNQMSNLVDSALSLAVELNHENVLSVLELLLCHGANMYAEGRCPYKSLLELLIARNRVPATRLLLERGFNLEHYIPRTSQDFSPLHEAISRSSRGSEEGDMLSLLLEFNSGGLLNLEHENQSEHTPLCIAVQIESAKCVKVLVDAGADLNHFDSKGRTPCIVASADPPYNRNDPHPMLKLLLSLGADMYATNPNSSESLFEYIVCHGRVSAARCLLESGLDLTRYNPQTPTDFSPLHHAIEYSDLSDKMVSLLLEYNNAGKLSLEHEDSNGYTPLCVAVQKEARESVELLLNAGANVDHIDFEGHTPLELALQKSPTKYRPYKHLIQPLVGAGAKLRNVLAELLEQNDADQGLEKAKCVVKYRTLYESQNPLVADPMRQGSMGESVELQNYYEACRTEIELMKNSPLHNSITHYDLLVAPEGLHKRVRDDHVYEKFDRYNIKNIFSIHAEQLCEHFSSVSLHHYRWEKAVQLLSQYLRLNPDIYYSIIRKILDYLDDENLQSMADCE